ncbi:MAG: ParB/RepB/Spo0J family partition protein [Eubacteriales bacterium]
MELFKKSLDRVQQISIGNIFPNPKQPRTIFSETELNSLAQSIKELGILQPLTVRKISTGWELIAGERRLRAAQIAGLSEVPCLLKEVGAETSSLLALVENIQRENLDHFEEANAIAQVIADFGLSQDETAKKLGKSQSAVANLLRLLRLSPPVVQALREGNCTQRHARALLKLPDEKQRLKVVKIIREKQLNVSQTEAYIKEYLDPPPPKKGKQIMIIKDVRLFLNTINKGLDLMKTAGVNAQYHKEEGEEEILLTIKIPRNPNLKGREISKERLERATSPSL